MTVIELMVNEAALVFESVTVCAALGPGIDTLPNGRRVGKALAVGAVPVPFRVMSCGLPGALSLTSINPL